MNLYRLLFLTIISALTLLAGGYDKPKSFSHAKKIFKQMDLDYVRTAFSNEEYMYDPTTCLSKLYLKKDHNASVIFVRIVPEELMGKNRACFNEKICKQSNDVLYSGARCCRKVDALYKLYERDIFNIMPIVEGTPYLSVEPPVHIRGNIARVYLYMNQRYALGLSAAALERYQRWDKEDTVDAKECDMHQKIFKVQGVSNPWIKSACETLSSKSSKSSQE